MEKNVKKWCLCFGACAALAGCAPHSTEDRLSAVEMRMQGQQVIDMRLSHVEAKIGQMEEDIGVIRAAVTAGAEKGRRPAPRAVAPQPSPQAAPPKNYPVQAAPTMEKAATAPAAENRASTTAPTPGAAPMVAASGEKRASSTEGVPQSVGASGKERSAASVSPLEEVDLAEYSNEMPSYLGSSGKIFIDRGPEPVAPPPKAAHTSATSGVAASGAPAEKPAKSAPVQGSSEKVASPTGQPDYDAALAIYEARRFKQAEERFAAFLATHPGHKLAPNATYWLGESYYASGQFTTAIVTFKEVVAQFPKHPKAAAALLKLGFAYAQMKDMENARFYWNILLEDFPGTPPAAIAKQRLAGMQ